jgi:hypothetical protein
MICFYIAENGGKEKNSKVCKEGKIQKQIRRKAIDEYHHSFSHSFVVKS